MRVLTKNGWKKRERTEWRQGGRASLADGVISIRDPLHRTFGRRGGGRSRSGGLEGQPLHCTAASKPAPPRPLLHAPSLSRGLDLRSERKAVKRRQRRRRRREGRTTAEEEAAVTIRFAKLPPRRRMSGGSPQRPRPAELGSQGVMSSKKAHTESRLRFITFTPAPAPAPGAIPLSGELGNQCVRRRLQSVRAAVARCHSCTMQFLSLSPSPSSFLRRSQQERARHIARPKEQKEGAKERRNESRHGRGGRPRKNGCPPCLFLLQSRARMAAPGHLKRRPRNMEEKCVSRSRASSSDS